ncbi:hypothetical protein RHMOL_Rhmol01G0062800 [Rhododendron molle]|uniref:Uncharacterized protein n=1 Tax=Rhododendron molle TaxID=49168 RepID=A0ACC0PYE5_RHOML|nr:hypothetical protein RHMOL_Rhmol01G0062800 [Rhododendron molle]
MDRIVRSHIHIFLCMSACVCVCGSGWVLHVVNSIQQRSNSLFLYELQEIVHAVITVIEESAKIGMLVKVKKETKKRSTKFKYTSDEGTFRLNQMGAGSLLRLIQK